MSENYSFYIDVGDGATSVFTFTFVGQDKGYLREDDIKVEIDGVDIGFTLDIANPNQMTFASPPASGAIILMRRIMPKDVPFSHWANGNDFSQNLVNSNFLQLQYTLHEILDGYFPDGWTIKDDLDMGGKRIFNLGAPKFSTDAVRLIDLTGGDGEPTAVSFIDGTAYVLLDTALSGVATNGDSSLLTINIKLTTTATDRFLAGETATETLTSSARISGTTLVIKSATDVDDSVDITSLGLPVNQYIDLILETYESPTDTRHRLIYDGKYSDWIVDSSVSGAWRKIFGYGDSDSGVNGSVSYMTYKEPAGLEVQWSFGNLAGSVVPCNIAAHRGVIQGVSWEGVDPDTGLITEIDAPNVNFDVTGTSFPSGATNVDEILRDIDSSFARKGEDASTDQPPNGTPLAAHETWLADTTTSARSRPLASVPLDGDELTVRDDKGKASVNNITIGRNGKTIMGLTEDLIISTDWTWVRLKYIASLGDWRVTGGGVGAQVVFDLTDQLELAHPVDTVHISLNPANPATYFNFGTWVPWGEGRALIGVGSENDGTDTRTFQVGQKVGEYAHTLGINEMPPHKHDYSRANDTTRTAGVGSSDAQDDDKIGDTTESTGGGDAHNNIQPSIAAFIWVRTA